MSALRRKKKNRFKPDKRRQAKPAAAKKRVKRTKPAKPAKPKAAGRTRRPKKSPAAKAARPARRKKTVAPKRPRPEPMGLGPLAPLTALVVLCGLLFFVGIGQRTLWESDEARYGEIAREMVVSGDWVTPRLNQVKYFEKPPLTYWLTAISLKVFGINALAVRLVPALFGTLTVLLIYFLGRLWWDWRTGFSAALVLATSLMFLILSRVVLVDMVMCFGVVLAMYGFVAHAKGYTHGLWAFWTGLAVAFLSKGLLGLGLPVMATGIYVAITRQWSLALGLLKPWGLAWFLVLAAPWVVLVSIRNPEFFQFFFIDEHFGRLLTTRHQRWEPYWFYFLVVPAGFFPWIAYLPWSLARQWPKGNWLAPDNRAFLFNLVWFGSFFLLFTVSSSKMVHYALPMMPALAMLTAPPLASLLFALGRPESAGGLRRSLVLLAALLVAAGAALLWLPALLPDVNYHHLGVYLLLGPAALAGLGLAIYTLRRRAWAVWAAPLVTMVLVCTVLWLAASKVEPYRSVAGLIEVIKPQLRYGDRIVTYRDFYNGAAFYSGQRIVISRHWGELRFGFEQEPRRHNNWFLPDDDFLFRVLASPRRRFFILCLAEYYPELAQMARDRYKVPIFLWARRGDKVVLSNRPQR